MRSGWLVGLFLLTTGLAAAQEPKDSFKSLEKQLSKVIANIEPSIVGIVVSHNPKYPPLTAAERNIPGWLGRYTQNVGPFRNAVVVPVQDKLDLSDPQNVADNTYGTGIVLDDATGLVLTNFHLVEGAVKIYVRFSNGKGSYANFHAYDGRSDLAVLKLMDVPADGLRSVKLGTVRVNPGPNNEPPNVSRGQFVISVGHPGASGFVDGIPSASWGILSNIRRRSAGPTREEQRNRTLHSYGCLLQTDARITLGCSGAGLFNTEGELIGVSTPLAAVLGAETAGGLVLPMDPNYKRIVQVLARGQEVEYGFLGIQISSLRVGERLENGLLVGSVIGGMPAAEAGLFGGDYILAVDGNPLKDHDDLFLYVGAALAGTKVKLTLFKEGRVRHAEATLVKGDNAFPVFGSNAPKPVAGLRVEYTSVRMAQNAAGPLFGGGGLRGVIVRDIAPKSEAEAEFKRVDGPSRWVITHVNDVATVTPSEFYKACLGQTQVEIRLQDPTTGESRTITLKPSGPRRP